MMKPVAVRLSLALLLIFPPCVEAQTVTAFKTGEQQTGMTKQCFYKFGASEYTRTVKNIELCPLSIQVQGGGASRAGSVDKQAPPPPPQKSTVTAFKTGEKQTDMTKQCFYKFGASEYTRTVKNIELCPLSIQVAP